MQRKVKNGELKLPLTIIKKSIVVLISDPHNGTIFSNISRKFYHRRLYMRDKYQYESIHEGADFAPVT